MNQEKVELQALQVYQTRRDAEKDLYRYAHLVKSWGLVPKCRVKAAPMMKGHYKGTWGVWLVKHR